MNDKLIDKIQKDLLFTHLYASQNAAKQLEIPQRHVHGDVSSIQLKRLNINTISINKKFGVCQEPYYISNKASVYKL